MSSPTRPSEVDPSFLSHQPTDTHGAIPAGPLSDGGSQGLLDIALERAGQQDQAERQHEARGKGREEEGVTAPAPKAEAAGLFQPPKGGNAEDAYDNFQRNEEAELDGLP
ncbi:hypothetical protein JCM8097_003885 [Rhodosporidiobolus ruineniae]